MFAIALLYTTEIIIIIIDFLREAPRATRVKVTRPPLTLSRPPTSCTDSLDPPPLCTAPCCVINLTLMGGTSELTLVLDKKCQTQRVWRDTEGGGRACLRRGFFLRFSGAHTATLMM